MGHLICVDRPDAGCSQIYSILSGQNMSMMSVVDLYVHSSRQYSVSCLFVCTVPSENGKLPFPAMSELNARLRRIVAAFQKSHKKELMKQEQNEKVRISVILPPLCQQYHLG